MKFTGTTPGILKKEIIFGKQLNWKILNALFRELERYHGIKFLQTEEILSKPIFKKKIHECLFETLSGSDDYVEGNTLTQIFKFSAWLISTHHL